MKSKTFGLVVAVATCLTGAPAIAQADQPKPAKDPNEVVCEKQKELGSRIATKRVCMTRAQWAQQRLEQRQQLDRAQVSRGSCEGCQ